MVTSDNPTLGLKNAPVTIVEFSDFECPFSRQAFPIIRETTNTFGGKVLYQYRHFPISEIHANAENAVLASECANEQGKFWPYHDKLFQNQDNLAIDSLKAYAAEIGLDEVQFANCFDSGKYESKIKRDRADGLFTGVRGTPTWFIDGVKIEGVIPLDVFRRIIQEQIEIKAKQGAKQR
jgi:protein-disulfide isomerase